LGKRGAKKKPGPRYPGGQIKPEGAGVTGTQLQRLRAVSKDPLLATQLGRLLFLEEITRAEYDTGVRVAEIYGRYERTIGRRRSVASPHYEAGRGRVTGEDDLARERAKAAAKAWGILQAEIKLCPRGVRDAIEELCVEDRACPPGWFPAVRIALAILGTLWRSGRRRGKE
jgi:hypothetical protein